MSDAQGVPSLYAQAGGSGAVMGEPPPALTTRERLLPWVIVALFALLALGWRSPGNTPFGVLRYHHAPALLVILMATGRVALVRKIEPLVLFCSFYTACYVTFSWFHGVPPFALQQGFYLVTAFMVAATLRTATERDWRVLRWAGPIAVALFLVVFWADARTAGVNAIATYRDAVATGNLSAIQFVLFARVFEANVVESLVSSPAHRHEVFAGLLVAIYCSVYACTIVRRKGTVFGFIYWASIAVAAALIALSLSRSLQLVVALASLLPLFRIVVLSRARVATMAAILLAIGMITVVSSTPIADFVWERLSSDTGSYRERGAAASSAIDSIASSPLIGGPMPAVSSHNFFLDATIIGGVLTGTLALAVMLLMYRDWIRMLGRYVGDQTLFAPLAAALVALVFMFTVGTGTLNLPECMGLALFYGVFTAVKRPSRDQPEPRQAVLAAVGPGAPTSRLSG